MDSNTIYQYYKIVDDRFYLARTYNDKGQLKLRYMWLPMVKGVKIKGFEDFDFFIWQDHKCLMLVEALTGAVILRQCDLQSRIMRRCGLKLFTDCLPAELNIRGGRVTLNSLIINFMVDHEQEISPRYQTIKV